MKKVSSLLCTLLLMGVASFGQSLTQADRDKGIKYLEQTRDAIVTATTGLSDGQMKFKPAPDRWSVAETFEHITLGEDLMFQSVTDKIMKAPAGPADRDTAKIDAMILNMVPDRAQKRQAPGPLVPTDRWTPSETLDHFLKSRTRTIEFLKSTPDLRAHASAENPLQQPLDAYDWMLFIGGHSERHTKQMLEVKADPNFPKN